MQANTTQLFEFLLRATRTYDENEAKQWWYSLMEILSPSLKPTIQGLAQQLDKENLSILHYIAFYNNLFICEKLVQFNCNFNTSGENGETILHIAARSKLVEKDTYEQNRISLLNYLLSSLKPKKKPLINMEKRDNQGRTALHHAVMSNRMANVQLLIDYHACIAAKDIRHATPLHYACRFNQQTAILRSLLIQSDFLKIQQRKCSLMHEKSTFSIQTKFDYLHAKTQDGHDAFSLARMYNHQDILTELYQHIPLTTDQYWNEKNQEFFQQIYQAILDEDISTLQFYPSWLVINQSTDETIFHLACRLGYAKIIQYYLQSGNLKTIFFLREKQYGFNPLLSAAYAGQFDVLECLLISLMNYLLSNKFLREIFFDRTNRNLFHLCILSGEENLLKLIFEILQTNSYFYVQIIENILFDFDFNDESALHLAVRFNFYSICRILLQFADRLDEIQPAKIDFDQIDGELIRTIDTRTNNYQSKIYLISLKNRLGQSPFHLAILYGHEQILNLFLEHVDHTGRNYLLEHTDLQRRTSLHLAAWKGYYSIVKQLFSLNINVYARDEQESTALHYVARCIEKKYLNKRHISVWILDLFLNYIQNSKRMPFDLLTAIDGFGHNCLETAIVVGNRSFIEYLLSLNNRPLFENLLRNAQILDQYCHHIDTPLRKLINHMPDIAYRVLDIFIISIGNGHKIIYDFQFLEDHCSIIQWQKHVPGQSMKCSIHRQIFLRFQNKFSSQIFAAYTRDPYILVHNNVLSVMCKSTKQIDLKDQKNDEHESKHIQYSYKLMRHPLCEKLMHLKWRQSGLPIFFISFFFYCLYVILFTTIMLRNKQPEYFYRLVNATFPNRRYGNGTELKCIEVGQRLLQLNIESVRKVSADRVLKIIVIILLWFHMVKNTLLIIGVHRCSLVWRLWIETATLILSFLALYDDNQWQSALKLRCPVQWQIGSFGVFLAWITLLSYLRFLPILGVYVVMLEVIILKFLWFAPVLGILICSFSFAFYMLLQNQLVFSTIAFAWFRSAFMFMDTGYEDRFLGSDSDAYISFYPILFLIFLLFGVTMTILVNNLLTALAVGEIADLSAIARVRNVTRRYELLRELEIFRFQCLWTPAPLHIRHEHIEKK